MDVPYCGVTAGVTGPRLGQDFSIVLRPILRVFAKLCWALEGFLLDGRAVLCMLYWYVAVASSTAHAVLQWLELWLCWLQRTVDSQEPTMIHLLYYAAV
jgi:hypothetical protein